MKVWSRVLIALFSGAMIIAYFFPLWYIDLEAPQYPEGLGLEIWVNRIGGDLETINGLNHYIGMKHIVPESIPELSWMPYILGFLIFSGILVAIVGNRILATGWVVLFLITGIAGGIDFYLWGYDYGHNLDPMAAIKVPGMSYQPPVWGSKTLLNFVAHSYPHVGGWAVILAGSLSMLILLYEWFFNRLQPKKKAVISSGAKMGGQTLVSPAMLVLGSLILNGCTSGPEPIEYGSDLCALCKMTITDHRYGSEVVSAKGRIYKFDSVECMVIYLKDNSDFNLNSAWITDYNNPGKLIPAESAGYLISENLPSPMGANLTATVSLDAAKKLERDYPGQVLTWLELPRYID